MEVATTVNESAPAAVPGLGVSVRTTSRKLLAPGGTSTLVLTELGRDAGRQPVVLRVNESSLLPVLVSRTT